jgi:hypothetical protein
MLTNTGTKSSTGTQSRQKTWSSRWASSATTGKSRTFTKRTDDSQCTLTWESDLSTHLARTTDLPHLAATIPDFNLHLHHHLNVYDSNFFTRGVFFMYILATHCSHFTRADDVSFLVYFVRFLHISHSNIDLLKAYRTNTWCSLFYVCIDSLVIYLQIFITTYRFPWIGRL